MFALLGDALISGGNTERRYFKPITQLTDRHLTRLLLVVPGEATQSFVFLAQQGRQLFLARSSNIAPP